MYRRLLLFLALLALLAASGCLHSGPHTNESTPAEAPILRVGISTNSPPVAFKDKGQISGLEAEFARGLARFSGRKIKFIELPWNQQIPALLANRTDIIMSGMTKTKARNYRIAFANSYMITGQVSLVRLDEVNRYSNGFTDLLSQSVRIGTIKGTTGDLLVQKNKARGSRTQYATSRHAVQGLLDKKIDAFVYDLPGNFYYGSLYAEKGLTPVVIPLTREQLAWGLRPDDAALMKTANNYLNALKQNGELQQMVERWIPFYKNIYDSNH